MGPLNVSSTTNSIVMMWTAPEILPATYVPTIACALLCNSSQPYPSDTPTISGTSNSATFSGLLPWSQCNITLTAQCGAASSNTLMVTATTMFASEEKVVCLYVCVFVCVWGVFVGVSGWDGCVNKHNIALYILSALWVCSYINRTIISTDRP